MKKNAAINEQEKAPVNRDNLRILLRELKELGLKEVLGFNISTEQTVADLKADMQDAVREIFIADRAAEFEAGLKKQVAKDVWEALSSQLKALKQDGMPSDWKGEAAEEDFKDEPVEPETDMDGCQYHAPEPDELPLSGGDEKEIAEVKTAKDKLVSEILGGGGKKKKAPKAEKHPMEQKRAKNGLFWDYILRRVSQPHQWKEPPTRKAILSEMADLFPHATPKSHATQLAGVKSWKWTKLDVLLVEDEDGLFKVGEKRPKK